MAAFRPGASPPPVRMPIRITPTSFRSHARRPLLHGLQPARGSGPIGSRPKPGRTTRAAAPSRSGQPAVPLPRPQVLDVGAGLRGMHTRQRVLAGRVPFHGEEVEAALIAEDVQPLGQVGAVPPTARSLSLAAREVEPTSRTLAESFPPRHLDRLRVYWKPSARPHAEPKGLAVAGLPTQTADPRKVVGRSSW